MITVRLQKNSGDFAVRRQYSSKINTKGKIKMDTFAEQLVQKQQDSTDYMKRIGIIAGGIVLIFVLLYITLFYVPIAILGAAAVAFGAYWLLILQSTEYEYAVTNGSLDIDKIMGKRKRASLVSVEVKDFKDFGEYNPESDFSGTTVMAVGGDEKAYFADFYSENYGETRLVFSPDERTLSCIKPYLPRTIKARFN